jgi:hypothetical protein
LPSEKGFEKYSATWEKRSRSIITATLNGRKTLLLVEETFLTLQDQNVTQLYVHQSGNLVRRDLGERKCFKGDVSVVIATRICKETFFFPLKKLSCLQAWDVTQLYYARHQNEKIEQYGATWEKDLDTFLGKCDVISINVPLTDKTR